MSVDGYLLLVASIAIFIFGVMHALRQRSALGDSYRPLTRASWRINAWTSIFIAVLLFLTAQGPIVGKTVALIVGIFVVGAAVLVAIEKEKPLAWSWLAAVGVLTLAAAYGLPS